MKINGETQITGIIGYPIKHTLSPVFQNAAFEQVGLNWAYLPFDVKPEMLETALTGLASFGCRGLNVTMPYKKVVFELVEELDESAEIAGAVNTVEFRDGRLIGHNTDGSGFIKSLKEDADFEPAGKRGLIVGAGGAATSIALSLAAAGLKKIKILNRTQDKADNIVGLIRSHFSGCVASVGDILDPSEAQNCDLVVNATSIGMDVNPGMPLSLDRLQSGQVVYDLVYWPAETEFLRSAKRKGAQVVNGASMLLYQGAAAFTIWTKHEAPLERMAAVLKQELNHRGEEEASATSKQSAGKDNIRGEIGQPGTTGRSKGG